MDFELLDVSDPRWKAYLARLSPYDFYHLPEYLQIESEHHGALPRAVVVSNGQSLLFVPFLQRDIPSRSGADTYFDLTGPYGYGCPLFVSPESDCETRRRQVRQALDLLREEFASRGVVSLFLRLHPLIRFPIPNLHPATEAIVRHGKTVYVDLTEPEETQWNRIGPSTRTRINRARKAGLTTIVDEDWRYLDHFISIYHVTMKRLGADPMYFFSRRYFEGMRDQMGDVMRLSFVLYNDSPVSTTLFSEVNGIAQYHLGGSLRWPQLNRMNPERLLMDFVRREATRRGNRFLHLGGGFGGSDDSLLYFKLSFSPTTSMFSTIRMVVNPEAYADLIRDWECRAGQSADDIHGFFPAYRKQPQRVEVSA